MSKHASIIIAISSLIISLILLFCSYGNSFFSNLDRTTGFWGVVVSAVALVVTCFFVILAIDSYKQIQKVAKLRRQIEKGQKTLEETQKIHAETLKNLEKTQANHAESQKNHAESITNLNKMQATHAESQKIHTESITNLNKMQDEMQATYTTSQTWHTTFLTNLVESMWESYTLQYASLGIQGKAGSIATYVLLSRGRLGYLFPTLEPQKRIQCFNDLAKVGTHEDMAPLRRIFNDRAELQEIRRRAGVAHNAIRARNP